MPVEAAMKRRTFPILLVLLVFLFTSCNGILQEEDEYGQASSFTLIDGDESSQISATNPFTVLLFTDVHVGRESRVPASYQPYGDLNTWVGNTFPVTGNPQVMITLGDLTDNSTDGQYQGVKDLLDAVRTKPPDSSSDSSSIVYSAAAIGNHDNRRGGRGKFFQTFGSMYQAFSYGGYSFYILDTSDRSVSKAQLEKLIRAVKADPNPKFFLTHYPLSANAFTYYSLALSDSEQRDVLIDLMLDNKVGMWIAGHRHHQEGPFAFSDTCHEITLASLNGLDDGWESPPTWYTMTVDPDADTATLVRYEWHKGDTVARERDRLVFNLPHNS
jgi:hypothetical protein